MTEAPTLTREQIEVWRNLFNGLLPHGDHELVRICDMALSYLDIREVKADAPVDGEMSPTPENDCLRSKPDFHADAVEQLEFELAFELEEASLDANDYVTVNRTKLRAIAERVLKRHADAIRAATPEPKAMRPADWKTITDFLTIHGAWSIREVTDAAERVKTALQSKGCALPEWQLVDNNAPKDGTWVFGYWPTMKIDEYPAVMFYDQGVYANPKAWSSVKNIGYGNEEIYPTHWAKIPAAPQPPKE